MNEYESILHGIRHSLETAASKISTSVSSVEEQFLYIGSHLNQFGKKADTISLQTIELTERIEAVNSHENAANLSSAMDKMKEEAEWTSKHFADSVKVLAGMRETVSGVRLPLERFSKIVKRLSALAISTKIESSQLDHMEIDFLKLAGDVEKLAQMISVRTSSILKNTQSIDLLLFEALRKSMRMERRHEEKVKQFLTGIESNIEAMRENNRLAGRTAESVSNEILKVKSNIDEVIVSMQFHDITRQQIDHVAQSISMVSQKLIEESRSNISRGNGYEDGELKLLMESGCLFELQKSQLESAKAVFVQAVDKIVEHLRNIASNVFSMSNKALEIAGATDVVSSSYLSEVESGVSKVISALIEDRKDKSELTAVIGELSGIVSNMSQWVNDIEEIGSEIQIIAVNARIKAAHARREGAPLGVIAEAIQNLSIEAASEKTAMSEVLKNVIQATHSLQCAASRKTGEDVGDTGAIMEGLDGTLNGVKESHNSIHDISRTIDRTSRELAEGIENAILDFTAKHAFVKLIDDLSGVFEEMYDRIYNLVPPDAWEGRDKRYLDEVRKNYTMHSERMIHREYESPKPKSAQSRSHESSFPLAPNQEDQWGNNVELF